MRLIRNILFLIIGLLIGASISLAHAEDVSTHIDGYLNGSTVYSTPVAACVARNPGFNSARVSPDIYLYECGTGTSYGQGQFVSAKETCPTGSTYIGSHLCRFSTSCVAPAVRQSDGSCAVPDPCPARAGTSYGQSVFQYNASAAAAYNGGDSSQANNVITNQCDGGCQIKIDPASTWTETSAVVAGTTTSFVQGNAKYTGVACTGSQTAPMSTTPPSTCATGQTAGTINGKFACLTSAGTPVNTTKPVTTTENPPVSQPDGSTKQTSITSNSDGSITTTTITTASNGTKTTETSTTPSISLSTGAGTGTGTGSGANIDTSTLAKDATLQAIKDALTVTGSINGKAYPTQPDSYYESEYPDGVQGVWNDFKGQVNQTPFIALANSMNPGWSGGTCPTWSMDFSGLHLGGIQSFGDLCWIFAIIKAIFIVTALFTARALLFGG